MTTKKKDTPAKPDASVPASGAATDSAVQAPPPEQVWASELAFLAGWDSGARPPS